MQLSPYLTFNGQCEAAFKFYERCLGGKIVAMITHVGTPAEENVPTEWRNKILHARLVVGDEVLMASDVPPERYEEPKGFSVALGIDDPADAERMFHALAGRKWDGADAAPTDLLGRPFWHACRSIRHTVDG
jgi:PhnB protein